MDFIKQVVQKYNLDQEEVAKDYADYLIQDKGLPSESREAIIGIGDFGRMEKNADLAKEQLESATNDLASKGQASKQADGDFGRELAEKNLSKQPKAHYFKN